MKKFLGLVAVWLSRYTEEKPDAIINAKLLVDYKTKNSSPNFGMHSGMDSYETLVCFHIDSLAYFYSIPKERWDNSGKEEVYVKFRDGNNFVILYDFFELQRKYTKFYA